MPNHNYVHQSHALPDMVTSTLEGSPYRGTQDVEFEIVDQDNVVLRGRVASYYQKQFVQESVRSIPGVEAVQNELQVMAYATN